MHKKFTSWSNWRNNKRGVSKRERASPCGFFLLMRYLDEKLHRFWSGQLANVENIFRKNCMILLFQNFILIKTLFLFLVF